VDNLGEPTCPQNDPFLLTALQSEVTAELQLCVPASNTASVHMRPILANLVDEGHFAEFKPLFGTTLIAGFARFGGELCGVLANDGPLSSPASLKGLEIRRVTSNNGASLWIFVWLFVCVFVSSPGAHFVQLCQQRNLPLVFFQVGLFHVPFPDHSSFLAGH
jgi:3-methylcrotonyl-CoA carboxylase beta subunit